MKKISTHLVECQIEDKIDIVKKMTTRIPLSPFLYILMADALSRKLDAKKKVGTVPSIRIVKGIEPINHSLFVDNSLLLGGASIMISKSFSRILQDLCSITGALVNKRKSVVYGWNTEHNVIQRIANSLGFLGYASWDKIKYLGLPLTLGPNRASLWNDVMNKLR